MEIFNIKDFQDSGFQYRSLRTAYLKEILAHARKCFIIPDKGHNDKVEPFKKRLQELCSEAKITVFNLKDGDVKIHHHDVIFPLYTDFEKYHELLNALAGVGIKLFQVISPGILFFPFLAETRGFIIKPDMSKLQFPVIATVETVNMCNLSCATCIKPTWQETNEYMDFNLFVKILDKLKLLGIQAVELYNFSEPFLNPKIYEFMAEIKKRGLSVGISSNLSRKNIPKLKECVDLLTPNDWFVITISGIRQEIYEINHRRGKIENVIENIQEISKSAPEHKQQVRLRLLQFDYNVSELEAAKSLAAQYGINFEWFVASGDPLRKPCDGEKERQEIFDQGLNYEDYNNSFYPQGFYCFFIHSRNIVIDHRGNVELCCNFTPRPYHLGSFLEQDFSVIQLKRDMHPRCRSCNYHGGAEAQSLTRAFPVNQIAASNMMRNGMDIVCLERLFAPKIFMPELKDNREFLQKSVEYFIGVNQ